VTSDLLRFLIAAPLQHHCPEPTAVAG